MPTFPLLQNFVGARDADDFVLGVTPPARLEYLVTGRDVVKGLATTPYAHPGLINDFDRAGGGEKVLAIQVHGIATKALRGKFARAADGVADPPDTSAYSASSGATGSDEILVPSPHGQGADTFPPDAALVAVSETSDVYDPTPTAAGDRLFEATGTLTGPTVEKFEITYAIGFSVVALQHDLEDVEGT